MSNKITVLIAHFNDTEFIETSLYALDKLTTNPFKVHIMDNGSEIENYRQLQEICKKYPNVHEERWDTALRTGVAHGTALNKLIKYVDTPYFSILDADATWLKKGWDEILIPKFTDEIKVIGTQASGNKPMDFPLMFAILFESEAFKKLDIDFRPKDLSKNQDTGHEMRGKYHAAGFKGEVLEMKNTRTYKDGPFAKFTGVGEFYMDGVDGIFVSHYGQGHDLGIHKFRRGLGRYFYKIPVLGTGLARYKALQEKRRWIEICREIVDRQG